MQLDAWRLRMPTMFSLTRSLVNFALFYMRVIRVSSIWTPTKICTSRNQLSISGCEWMQLNASRLKLPKMCSLWRNLSIFALFCMRITKVSSLLPPTKICTFRQKMLILWLKWMQLDAWRLRMPTMYSLWRNLLIFALLCMRVIKVSSLWPPTKICTFRRKLSIFGCEWMQLDAWKLKLPKRFSLWQKLSLFALFCMRFTKVRSFCPPTKTCTFRAKLSVFGCEWMQSDAWRLKLPKTCSLWQNLSVFAQICVRVTKVSSFWPP